MLMIKVLVTVSASKYESRCMLTLRELNVDAQKVFVAVSAR